MLSVDMGGHWIRRTDRSAGSGTRGVDLIGDAQTGDRENNKKLVISDQFFSGSDGIRTRGLGLDRAACSTTTPRPRTDDSLSQPIQVVKDFPKILSHLFHQKAVGFPAAFLPYF